MEDITVALIQKNVEQTIEFLDNGKMGDAKNTLRSLNEILKDYLS